MLRGSLAGVIACLASAAVAQPLAIASGTALTFAVAGTPPQPAPPVRRGPIGPAAPAPGQITVGLAPAGNAVMVTKLHVFERTTSPIHFEATAMRGEKALTTQVVCGRLEMDAWVTFPADTQTVRLSGFSTTKSGCDR